MVYGGLNIADYPRKAYVPGRYDPDRIKKSPHLKTGHSLPIPSDPKLNCVGQELHRLLGELHTSLNFPKNWTARVRLIPDSGSPAEGADWLLPHVDEYNAVTFDTESCTKSGGTTYAIFGTLSGHVLLVDLRHYGQLLPEALGPLVEGRLVLGAALQNDVSVLRKWNFQPADTLPFSAKIQRHRLYPYRSFGKTSLKFIPEMVYGHHYGGRFEKVKKGGQLVLCPHFRKYPQPFSWPRWLNPVDLYDFSGPLNEQQLAYMKNDGLAPVIHVLLYGLLELCAGEVKPGPIGVRSVICHALDKGFGLKNDLETPAPASARPCDLDLLTFEDLDKEFANDLLPGPNWECAHGLQPGLNDSAMKEKLVSFPKRVQDEIRNYTTLNPNDDEDQIFLDLFGGFPTLKRAASILATLDAEPEPLPNLDQVPEAEPSASEPLAIAADANSERPQSGSGPVLGPDTSATPQVNAKRPRSSSEHTHGPDCKRRKIEVEMWECPMEGFVMVMIPTPNAEALKKTPMILESQAEVGGAEPRPEPAEVQVPEPEPQLVPSVQSPEMNTPPAQVNAALEVEPESPAVREPHEVEQADRLRLIQGMLADVPLPEPIRLPHCFTGVPLFRSRCQACGYRSQRKGHNTVHPVGACPVLANLAKLYYNLREQRWVEGHRPCEYRLCRTKTSHLEKMCPMLHSFCLECGLRGHVADDCEAAHQRFGRIELEAAYNASRQKGIRTRKQHPVWNFSPEIPPLRLVTHGGDSFLFPWTEATWKKFNAMTPEDKAHEVFIELAAGAEVR